MTAEHWLWLALIIGPVPVCLPAWFLYRHHRDKLARRDIERMRQYRREKFGGFVSTPRGVEPVDRP